MIKQCPPGKILNPKTGRCVNIDGKVGKQVLAEKAATKKQTTKTSPEKTAIKQTTKTPPEAKLVKLHADQMKAMRERNIPLIRELAAKIDQVRKNMKKEKQSIPKYLNVCKDITSGDLPKIPTANGDEDMVDIIKSENQLMIIDGLCYDIKSLFDLINADIKQGNIWGINPYVRREGLILPFDKHIKQQVLSEGMKRGILPSTAKYVDHAPASADDIEMRGTYSLKTKSTPVQWLQKGWASDGTAFPTKKYYAITFDFPNKQRKQNPGRVAIFPYTTDAKKFINEKLIPVYEAGALWSKKISITDGIEVINPNIHMVYEDNQPNRWYKNKLSNLEEEILKFAPAFV